MSAAIPGHGVKQLQPLPASQGYVIYCKCRWRSDRFQDPSDKKIRLIFEEHKTEVRNAGLNDPSGEAQAFLNNGTDNVAQLAQMVEQTSQLIIEILVERLHQKAIGYTAEHDDWHGKVEWTWILNELVMRLLNPRFISRQALVEIAATTIAAIESYDRKMIRGIESLQPSNAPQSHSPTAL